MSKITIIGAGNVGATAALNIARMSICNTVVLLDIKEGVAEGKAMDIMQSLAIVNNTTEVIGVTNDYDATANSDVVVITSGVPRKPGMTREELVGVNKVVVESVMKNLLPVQNKSTKYLIVSNPMDTMTLVATNCLRAFEGEKGEPVAQVIGMGGKLDSARFKYFIKKAYEHKTGEPLSIKLVKAFVIGGHGDTTMVPWVNAAKINGKPISEIFTPEEIADIVENTKKGGATLTKMLGTSAWEAPATAIAETCDALVNGGTMGYVMMPCSVNRPEYNLCIGSYVGINSSGVVYIKNVEGNNPEYKASVEAVRKVNEAL